MKIDAEKNDKEEKEKGRRLNDGGGGGGGGAPWRTDRHRRQFYTLPGKLF